MALLCPLPYHSFATQAGQALIQPLCAADGETKAHRGASRLRSRSAPEHTPQAWLPGVRLGRTPGRFWGQPVGTDCPSLYDQVTLPALCLRQSCPEGRLSDRSHEAHTAALDTGTHVSALPGFPSPRVLPAWSHFPSSPRVPTCGWGSSWCAAPARASSTGGGTQTDRPQRAPWLPPLPPCPLARLTPVGASPLAASPLKSGGERLPPRGLVGLRAGRAAPCLTRA